jgi:hypothetical protein
MKNLGVPRLGCKPLQVLIILTFSKIAAPALGTRGVFIVFYLSFYSLNENLIRGVGLTSSVRRLADTFSYKEKDFSSHPLSTKVERG